MKYKDYPLENIEKPLEHDVMYGRGANTNIHPGNKKFRNMVENQKKRYVNSTKCEKGVIASEILQQWRQLSPPGRFLKKNEDTGNWDDVGNVMARDKTIQRLRENAPEIREQQKQQQMDKADDKGVNAVDQKKTDKKEISTRTNSIVKDVVSFRHSDSKREGSKNEPVSRPQLPHQEGVDEFSSSRSFCSITEQPESHTNQCDFQSKSTARSSIKNVMDIGKSEWQYDNRHSLEPSILPQGAESHNWDLSCRVELKRDISITHETNSPRVKKGALRRDLSATSNLLKQKYIPEYFHLDVKILNKTEETRLASPDFDPIQVLDENRYASPDVTLEEALVFWSDAFDMNSTEQMYYQQIARCC